MPKSPQHNGGAAAVVLLYQCGIANIVAAGGGSRRRLLQSGYRDCEMFALGVRAAGLEVKVAHADVAGDACSAGVEWRPGRGDLWSGNKRWWGPEHDFIASQEGGDRREPPYVG